MAIWYPAKNSGVGAQFVTQFEYRLLGFSETLDGPAKDSFLDDEAKMMVAWRHVGIVPMTIEQARASLATTGRAVRGAAPAGGKFPVVLILGGPWYLSTTAEILAANGFLVVAPVRFSDESSEVPISNFSSYLGESVRDAEWVLAEMSRHSAADVTRASAIGHGGGGMGALVLAMRNRGIRAVANIDAGNFSTRSNPRQLQFYDPRLLRVPYLYIATAGTRQESDQFADFEHMRFSRRYEVILKNPALRHHDLSDVGRGVSAPLGIRGQEQEMVLRHYADVQQMLVRFLRGDSATYDPWLKNLGSSYTVTVRDAVEPAPTTAQVLRSLNDDSLAKLTEAHGRDPEAELFSEDQLKRLVVAARTRNQPALAAKLVRFELELHPKSIGVHELAVATLEAAGERGPAAELARTCVALPVPQNDWRARDAHGQCEERLRQLNK